jgi:hypothetical protein
LAALSFTALFLLSTGSWTAPVQAQSGSAASSASQQNNATSAKPPSSAALLLETIQISYVPAGLKPRTGAQQLSANSHTAPAGGIEVITITGQRIGGGSVSIGFSCASMMCGAMQDSMSSWMRDQLAQYAQRFIEPEEVTERVCDTIRAMSPGYCATNYSSIARLRNFPNTWQFPATTNGCGSGSVEGLVFAVLRSQYSWNDNINEPILGHSFLSACNNHDICYNNQENKGSCDAVFHRAMKSVCGSNTRCLVASDLYHAAVNADRSVSAYMRAGQAATCSRIKQSYAANYCPAT